MLRQTASSVLKVPTRFPIRNRRKFFVEHENIPEQLPEKLQ
jgi:hypothetical protein